MTETTKLSDVGINKLIKDVGYVLSPSERAIICELVLQNGFIVFGEAHVSSIQDDTGKLIALNKAKSKIWNLEAYATHDRIHNSTTERSATEVIQTGN